MFRTWRCVRAWALVVASTLAGCNSVDGHLKPRISDALLKQCRTGRLVAESTASLEVEIAACEESLSRQPTGPGAMDARVSLGILLVRSGEHEEAIKNLRRAIREGSEDRDGLAALGEALLPFALGRRDKDAAAEAVRMLERAIRHGAESPRHHEWLAWCLFELGRESEGLDALHEAIRRDPMNVDRRVQIALRLNMMNKHDAALEQFAAAEKSAPEILRSGMAREVWDASKNGERWAGWDDPRRPVE